MKKFILLLIPFLFLGWGISKLSAQDCDGDPCVDMANCASWSDLLDESYIIDPSCPSCVITVYYYERDNSECSQICPNAPEKEFRIEFMVTDGSCFYPCNGNPPQYQFGDTDQLYMLGLFFLTRDLSAGNMNGNCGSVFNNFKLQSCKKQYVSPSGTVYILDCDEYDCCVQTLQYCNDNGDESLIKNDIVVPPNNCEPDPDDLECEFSCLWEWEDSFIPKEAKNIESVSDQFGLNLLETNGSLDYKLVGQLEGELNITVFNTEAKTIYNESYNVNSAQFENSIYNLLSGAYYISFELNGDLIKVDKFLIVE